MKLAEKEVAEILAFLDVLPSAPTVPFLTTILSAYTERVPWESASRLVRRAQHETNEACVNWPAAFWQQARDKTLGGTCFESNGALFALLMALGFEGYLTINNMGEQIGCHTAIVIKLGGTKWLVDVGMPLFVPIPFTPAYETHAASGVFHYRIRPDGEDIYQVLRAPHPAENAFTLIDRPVSLPSYWQAVTDDYGPGGYFLDRLVLNSRTGQTAFRFNSGTEPHTLESFRTGHHTLFDLGEDEAATIHQLMGIDRDTVAAALQLLEANS